MQDVPGAKPLPRIVGHVKFENVTFGYNPDRPVLHDVSFEAQPGQTVALVGATGSGKSSIISLIARFYQPQQGRVLVDGHDIRHVTGESLHRQMGLVLQVNYLFTGTVMENIRYATPGATERGRDRRRQGDRPLRRDHVAEGRLQHRGRRARREHVASASGSSSASPARSWPTRASSCSTRPPAPSTPPPSCSCSESLEKLLAGRTTFIVAHRLSTIMQAD